MKKRFIVSLIIGTSLVSSTMYGATEGTEKIKGAKPVAQKYSMEQAMSDKAQLSTIAFSGLAFITGNSGADTFIPPGKVADFFGFQYMRDIDEEGYGHNTTFLTKAANNILYILDEDQKEKLVSLAKEQATLYKDFAYNRLPLMKAFRENLEGNIPQGSSGLSKERVAEYTGKLYQIDAELTYERAVMYGEIIQSLTEDQKKYLAQMDFNNSATWPKVEMDESMKQSMNHTEFVAVMTYASEFFSWYKGSVEADAYFCPERQGTYFGGFFMKDYPAMNNPEYFISTEITGDKGQMFLNLLNPEQRNKMISIIGEQQVALKEIGAIRKEVSQELRKVMVGEMIDKEKVYTLIERYGVLDGELSALYATRFAEINKTLTSEQREKLIELRELDVVPEGIYMFSTPVRQPDLPETDFLFGIGEVPEDAGLWKAPESFGEAVKKEPNKTQSKPQKPENTNRID